MQAPENQARRLNVSQSLLFNVINPKFNGYNVILSIQIILNPPYDQLETQLSCNLGELSDDMNVLKILNMEIFLILPIHPT